MVPVPVPHRIIELADLAGFTELGKEVSAPLAGLSEKQIEDKVSELARGA